MNGIDQGTALPSDATAEKIILQSLILKPGMVAAKCLGLTPEAFYVPAYQIVFETLLDWHKPDEKVNFVWLQKTIGDRGRPDEVGGLPFLDSLYNDFNAPPENAEYYVDIVRDRYARRLSWQDSEQRKIAALDRTKGPEEWDPEGKHLVAASFAGYPAFESIDSLLDEQVEEPPELILGLLHQASKATIGGESKGRKTWLLTDLAVSVAAGVDWLGRSAKQGRVLYVNLEIQRAFYRKRVKAIAEAKGILLNGVWRKNLDVWNLRGYCMDAESLCKILSRKLTGKDYVLIVVDPLYKIVGNRQENSNDQITSLLNLLERVAGETGVAIAYGNHFSKGNQAAKESIDRISGAGAFARDPDTILTLTRHESDGACTVEATLRNFPPIEPFCVRWEYPLFVLDDKLNPADLKKPETGRKQKWSVYQLAELLGGKSLRSGAFQKLASSELGMPRATFYELIRDPKGVLHKSATDETWEVIRKVRKV
ncbi:MAG: hypothetical protein C5B58_16005 [Acidobacteria bacterium]|nr:MAG: hypothetical protein C5B58_16005 [Acidobacteriota bacterium]